MSDGGIVINAADWLAEDGDLPYDGPPELFRNALRMAQCIEYGGPLPMATFIPTLIQCRWRPDGVACRGTLTVAKTELDVIESLCLLCRREEFVITNWQDTLWAEGPPEPLPLDVKPDQPETERAPPPVEEMPAKIGRQLEAALRRIGSRLSVPEIQRMIATTDTPNAVIQRVLESSQPRDINDVQALANALMLAWNATPRAELGGKAPSRAHDEGLARAPAQAGPKVSRNAPCPCGSGVKHKKCCGLH